MRFFPHFSVVLFLALALTKSWTPLGWHFYIPRSADYIKSAILPNENETALLSLID